jgi:serine/threonine protein kinase
MEYYPRMDLMEMIMKTGVLEEELARIAFKVLAEQVQMMHRGGWAHRDIKLENTVIDKHGGLRLADFGMSIKGNRGRNLAGTKSYLPPELVPYRSD